MATDAAAIIDRDGEGSDIAGTGDYIAVRYCCPAATGQHNCSSEALLAGGGTHARGAEGLDSAGFVTLDAEGSVGQTYSRRQPGDAADSRAG